MPKTAGIVIIGDEVLSGKVEECNAHYMAKGLRAKGIIVRRISVIPDEVPIIAEEVKSLLRTMTSCSHQADLAPLMMT